MNNWSFSDRQTPFSDAGFNGALDNSEYVKLPDGSLGTIGDLVRSYAGGQQDAFHPTDLQKMAREQAMGVQR